jgi:hypothetical protein
VLVLPLALESLVRAAVSGPEVSEASVARIDEASPAIDG